MKALLLKFHRWAALLFALPLLVVLFTGLVLSFEPWVVTSAIKPGALTADRIEALLAQHDPQGQARAIAYRSYDGTVTIGGRSGRVIDVATGQELPGPSTLAATFGTMRRMHETLLLDAGGLVTASSMVMLALAVLGILMGWPRFGNTLAGWHKGVAWGLLPLVVLSPLTGLLLAYGVTLTSPPPGGGAKPAPIGLVEAVRVVGKQHDLSGLAWIRPQGGRMLARVVEDGEYRVYAVAREGTTPLPRNWPRLWHEGTFAGAWSAAMNAITSLAMLALLATGIWLWTRRTLRRRAGRRQYATRAATTP
jgi:uncharacterized iron-regulated membrane protein